MKVNKYETGDRVQVVGDFLNEWSGGKTFTITNFTMDIDGDFLYSVDDKFPWLREDWLKRVA